MTKKILILTLSLLTIIIGAKAQVEIVSGGTSTAYTVNVPGTFVLTNGLQVTFKAHTASSAAATLNVSGSGAISITKIGGSAPLAGSDILTNQIVTVAYDGTNWQMLSAVGSTPAASNDWTLTGNAIGAGNKLGTTNAFDLSIIAGGTTAITIDDVSQNIGIGVAPSTFYKIYTNIPNSNTTSYTANEIQHNYSGAGTKTGVSSIVSADGSGLKRTFYGFASASGTQQTDGFYSMIDNDGSGDAHGIYNDFSLSTGSGAQEGMRSIISNAGTSFKRGVFTSINQSGGANSSDMAGVHNSMASTSSASQAMFGMISQINNSSPTGSSYGIYQTFSGTSTGTQYGIYSSGEDLNYFSGSMNIGGALLPGGIAGTNGQVLTSSGGGVNTWSTPAASVNIYNSNGSLTNPRIVTQGGNTLAFTASAVNAFSVDGSTFSVDASGNNVGIGTASPQNKLHVNTAAGSTTYGQFTNSVTGQTTTDGLTVGVNGAGAGFISYWEPNDFKIQTNAINAIWIAQNGNVGIGTSPAQKLHVDGGTFRVSNGAAYADIFQSGTTAILEASNLFAINANGSTNVFTIDDGNADINVQLGIHDGSQGAGKLLTSDLNGYATWKTVTADSLGGWSTTGNAGIVDGTHFIGTTNAAPLNFKVNGQKAGRIDYATPFNTFFGYQSGNSATGSSNTGFGYQALLNNAAGASNNALGYYALRSNTTGGSNNAIGYYALYSNTTGSSNTANGFFALGNSTGSYNTAVGYYALLANNTGTYNTAIGYGADVSSGALTNATAIGANATVNQSNSLVLGNNANVGIGTPTPSYKVHTLLTSGYTALEATTSVAYGMRFISPDRNWYFLLSGGGTTAGSFGIYDGTASAYRMYIEPSTGNIGIGTKTPSTSRLNVEIPNTDATNPIGLTVTNNYTGALNKFGIDVNVDGAGSGVKYGISSSVVGLAGDASSIYGYQVNMTPNGTGTSYGIYSYNQAVGTGARYGFYNLVYAAATNVSTIYGVRTAISNAGTGNSYGIYNTGEDYNYFSGRVGIGVTIPTYALELPNNTTIGIGQARAYAWATYSDKRLKDNIKDIPYGLQTVLDLNPLMYNQHNSSIDSLGMHIEKESSINIGFLAQDLYKIVPQVVSKPEDESKDFWAVDYAKLVPVLTKAIQEQQVQIEELKKEINLLKNK